MKTKNNKRRITKKIIEFIIGKVPGYQTHKLPQIKIEIKKKKMEIYWLIVYNLANILK